MKKVMYILLCMCVATILSAQDKRISVELSRDTILLGNAVRLTYVLENIDGEIHVSDTVKKMAIQYPETRSSMQVINGEMKTSKSMSFILQPLSEGKITIPPAVISYNGSEIKSSEVTLTVLPNPNHIKQNIGKNQYSEFFKYNVPHSKVPPKEVPPRSKKLPIKRKIIKI